LEGLATLPMIIWPCTLPIGATVSLEMFSRRVVSSNLSSYPKALWFAGGDIQLSGGPWHYAFSK
jgi:hypothetical protein